VAWNGINENIGHQWKYNDNIIVIIWRSNNNENGVLIVETGNNNQIIMKTLQCVWNNGWKVAIINWLL
jgi:hypothetical protein